MRKRYPKFARASFMKMLQVNEDTAEAAALTENCIIWIHGHLIFGRIANETLRLRKGHIAGRGPVALIVGNDLNFAMLKDADTRICCTKINANCW